MRFLDTIVLKLCALAYPRPSVGWRHTRHNATDVSISGYSVSYDTTFARLRIEMTVHVQTPDMYGGYQVLVENEMGVLSRTFTLEAKGEKTIIDLARGIVFKLIVSKFNRLKRSIQKKKKILIKYSAVSHPS